jgi:hypothetical protein
MIARVLGLGRLSRAGFPGHDDYKGSEPECELPNDVLSLYP